MSGLPEIVDAQHASKEQQEEKHSLGYFSKCIKDAIEGSLRTQEYIGDPELESTWVVDDVLLESKSAKSSTSDASTNDSESQWYMEKKKPKQLIQIVAYQLKKPIVVGSVAGNTLCQSIHFECSVQTFIGEHSNYPR
jgi:hypothetical protein